MNELIIYVVVGLIIFIVIKKFSSFDKKVISLIENEASEKGLTVKSIRGVFTSDGYSPFEQPTIWIGASSQLLGMSGERVIDKIVTVSTADGEEQYWVEIKITMFIPSSSRWKRIEELDS